MNRKNINKWAHLVWVLLGVFLGQSGTVDPSSALRIFS